MQPGGKPCEIKLLRWTDIYDWVRRSYILDRRKFLLSPCKFQAYLPANNASYVMEAAVPSVNLTEQKGLLGPPLRSPEQPGAVHRNINLYHSRNTINSLLNRCTGTECNTALQKLGQELPG